MFRLLILILLLHISSQIYSQKKEKEETNNQNYLILEPELKLSGGLFLTSLMSMEFDKKLPEIMDALGDEDILILTADHGCDPTTESTDHSREYVPLLVYGRKIRNGVNLGTGKTFADIGQTLAQIFELEPLKIGEGFLEKVVTE